LQRIPEGHLFICTGFPHQRTDKKGNSIDLFPSKLAHGSWEMYKNGPVASREMNDLYADLSDCDTTSPLFTPLTLDDFSRLGPIYFQIARMDLWKDSALSYCDRLREAGSPVKVEVYPGVPHTWFAMYPQLSINRKWAQDLVHGVEWLLQAKKHASAYSRL